MEQDKQVKARKEAFETCWEAVEKEIKVCSCQCIRCYEH